MAEYWEERDVEIAQSPMPPEFKNQKIKVLVNHSVCVQWGVSADLSACQCINDFWSLALSVWVTTENYIKKKTNIFLPRCPDGKVDSSKGEKTQHVKATFASGSSYFHFSVTLFRLTVPWIHKPWSCEPVEKLFLRTHVRNTLASSKTEEFFHSSVW